MERIIAASVYKTGAEQSLRLHAAALEAYSGHDRISGSVERGKNIRIALGYGDIIAYRELAAGAALGIQYLDPLQEAIKIERWGKGVDGHIELTPSHAEDAEIDIGIDRYQ